jgi:PAS domain S-box-containing protein
MMKKTNKGEIGKRADVHNGPSNQQEYSRLRQAKASLLMSDKVFQYSIDMLCVAGFDGYFKVLSPAWTNTLGWSNEELMSRPWVDFVHPDDVKGTEESKTTLINGVSVYQFENRYRTKSGEYKILSWNSYPFPEEQVMFGVARDMTAQRKLDKDYKTLFNKMLGGFALHEMIYDKDGNGINYRFLTVNPAFERLTGLKGSDIIGKTVLEVLPGTEPHWIETYAKVAKGEGDLQFDSFSSELNKHFDVRAYSPAENHFVTIITDITERKQKEDEIRDRMEELERFQRLTVNRELTMIELKKEVNELLRKLGESEKYKIVESSH